MQIDKSVKPLSRSMALDFTKGSGLLLPIIFAAIIGSSTGGIAVIFIKLIAIFKKFFFQQGQDILFFMKTYYVILIPALGGLFVGPMITFFAPEAKGHGVPEVLKAIAIKGGKIRPIVVVIKAVGSIISIASGASVGREGPIVQIGSALGSVFAQIFKFNESRTKNFIACGAASGIAAVFNAPIAGVMFSSEVILRDFGPNALSPVVVAAVSSSIVSRTFLGASPSFSSPSYGLQSPWEIGGYLILSILSTLAALLFIKVLHFSEETFDRWKFPTWLKAAVGGLLVGSLGVFFPQVLGAGLLPIEQALHGDMTLKVLFILIIFKILATSISLGSGSSGGVFAPALFIGSMLGGLVGKIFFYFAPFHVAPSGAYALVGMACVFAAAAHAPVTAILIVFEMTGSYEMILPLMLAVVVATSISQFIQRESIYTIKLKQSGIDIGFLQEATIIGSLLVKDAFSKDFIVIKNNEYVSDILDKMEHPMETTIMVIDKNKEIVGLIHFEEIQKFFLMKDIGFVIAEDIASPIKDYFFPDEPLSEAARYMIAHHHTQMPVVNPSNPSNVIGVLRSEDIFHAYTHHTARHTDLLSQMKEQILKPEGMISFSFKLPIRSPLIGTKIQDLKLPEGVQLISIKRKDSFFVPQGKSILEGKDKIWASLLPDKEKIFCEWLKHNHLDYQKIK